MRTEHMVIFCSVSACGTSELSAECSSYICIYICFLSKLETQGLELVTQIKSHALRTEPALFTMSHS